MNERDRANIERIAEELRYIKSVTEKISREEFLRDDTLQHALSMSILTIGECANHLSDEFKDCNQQIEWVQIVAVRNIAAHGYWQLDMRQVWQAIEEDIPELDTFIRGLSGE
ncbi:MAG: DUF86 domain-containing protein [Peptococcaceae bacterium]|jgi:uncharacterized protein with HEPN domain|nr:DUF86 domain-containing protein [Peptococcaceae bacterium]